MTRSLEWFRERCDVIGDCWIWQRSVNSKGAPQYACGHLVRHGVWAALGRTKRSRKWRLMSRCMNPRCVGPDCLVYKTVGDTLRDQCATGRRSRIQALAAINAANPQRKLTWEIAAMIRQSSDPTSEIAQRHNVSHKTVTDIRGGRSWVPPQASVFTWRGAKQ